MNATIEKSTDAGLTPNGEATCSPADASSTSLRPTNTPKGIVHIPVDQIKVGKRHRKDPGDLQGLADSIKRQGLLQPVGVTPAYGLVFGDRRLQACGRLLKWPTIPAVIVEVTSIVEGELDENTMRKNYTISERVAIGLSVEAEMGERRGRSSKTAPAGAQCEMSGKTDDIVGAMVGLGCGDSYARAKSACASGVPELVAAMDAERLPVALAAELAGLPVEQQRALLWGNPQALIAKGRQVAQERKARNRSARTLTALRNASPAGALATTTHTLVVDDGGDMAGVADGSIGLVVTSIPYWNWLALPQGQFRTQADLLDKLKALAVRVMRVLKDGRAVVLNASDMRLGDRNWSLVGNTIRAFEEAGFTYRDWLTWRQPEGGFAGSRRNAFFVQNPYPMGFHSQHVARTALVFQKGEFKLDSVDHTVREASRLDDAYGLYTAGLLSDMPEVHCVKPAGPTDSQNPTCPLEVAELMVRLYSFVNETILDPFATSGTTLAAARKWNRNSMGFAIDLSRVADVRAAVGPDLIVKSPFPIPEAPTKAS